MITAARKQVNQLILFIVGLTCTTAACAVARSLPATPTDVKTSLILAIKSETDRLIPMQKRNPGDGQIVLQLEKIAYPAAEKLALIMKNTSQFTHDDALILTRVMMDLATIDSGEASAQMSAPLAKRNELKAVLANCGTAKSLTNGASSARNEIPDQSVLRDLHFKPLTRAEVCEFKELLENFADSVANGNG